jgi:hypothetical protein
MLTPEKRVRKLDPRQEDRRSQAGDLLGFVEVKGRKVGGVSEREGMPMKSSSGIVRRTAGSQREVMGVMGLVAKAGLLYFLEADGIEKMIDRIN